MKKKSIRAFAPATVANIGCGFDIFGLAIQNLGDEVEVMLSSSQDVSIKKITGDKGRLPYESTKNSATVAIKAMLKELGEKRGIDIILKKNMPLNSGLGSSASSSAAAVYATNLLLGNPFSKNELIRFAMEGERIACGTAHADNVAPSLLGGIILVRNTNPLDVIELPVPDKLYVVVVHPDIELPTKKSRKAIGDSVSINTATQQWGNTAAFVASLYKNDFELMSRSVVDFVAEPKRAKFISGFTEVKNAALKNGAIASSISGAGPSIFALTIKDTKQIAISMQKEFAKKKIKSKLFISKINTIGATEIK